MTTAPDVTVLGGVVFRRYVILHANKAGNDIVKSRIMGVQISMTSYSRPRFPLLSICLKAAVYNISRIRKKNHEVDIFESPPNLPEVGVPF